MVYTTTHATLSQNFQHFPEKLIKNALIDGVAEVASFKLCAGHEVSIAASQRFFKSTMHGEKFENVLSQTAGTIFGKNLFGQEILQELTSNIIGTLTEEEEKPFKRGLQKTAASYLMQEAALKLKEGISLFVNNFHQEPLPAPSFGGH